MKAEDALQREPRTMNKMGYTFLRWSSGEDQPPGYIDVDGANGAIWKPRSR